MRVKATKRGYYTRLREPGDIFPLKRAEDFSKSWMEKVAAGEPAAAIEAPPAERPADEVQRPRRGRPPKAKPTTEPEPFGMPSASEPEQEAS